MPFQEQREEVGDRRKVSRLVAAFLSGMNVEISAFVHMSTNCKRDWKFSAEVGEATPSTSQFKVLFYSPWLIRQSSQSLKNEPEKRTFFFSYSLCTQFLEERGTQIKEKRDDIVSFNHFKKSYDWHWFKRFSICMSQKKKCPSTLLCMLASSHRFSKGSSHLNQDHQDQSTQLQKEVYPSCALSLPHVSSKRSSLEFIHVTVFENHFKSLNLHHCARRQLILLRCSQSHPCKMRHF